MLPLDSVTPSAPYTMQTNRNAQPLSYDQDWQVQSHAQPQSTGFACPPYSGRQLQDVRAQLQPVDFSDLDAPLNNASTLEAPTVIPIPSNGKNILRSTR